MKTHNSNNELCMTVVSERERERERGERDVELLGLFWNWNSLRLNFRSEAYLTLGKSLNFLEPLILPQQNADVYFESCYEN